MNNNSVPGTSLFGTPGNSTGASSLFGGSKGTNPPAANNNSTAGLFGGGGATSFGNPLSAASTPANPTSIFGNNNSTALSQPPAATGNLFGQGAPNNANK